MDISINNRPTTIADPATLQAQAPAETAKSQSRPALVITEARADALSGPDATEEVPASALLRDAPLGKPLSAAFSLPAPPMPAFPS